MKTKAQQEGQIATIIEATVLEAICHHKLGNQAIALDILHEAFELAVKFYYVRTFLDEKDLLPLIDSYLEQLDQKWDTIPTKYFSYLREGAIVNTTPLAILTQREQEMYDLLAEGITNREIANELHLSEGTIRVYLSTIYSKLGVNSRAKAIALKNQQ